MSSLGNLKITDRAGDTATIDLRAARTIDDVLNAINRQQGIDVTASTDGDSIKLTDNTGDSGNLKVQEVSGGHTAADLGPGRYQRHRELRDGHRHLRDRFEHEPSSLNDGNGVELNSAGNDLHVTLADAFALDIDLGSSTTVGGALTAINAASPTKLSAAISADGKRLVLTDHTSGGGTFAVTDAGASQDGRESGSHDDRGRAARLTAPRSLSGLSDSLLSSLRGGAGVGTLGDLSITNRNGCFVDGSPGRSRVDQRRREGDQFASDGRHVPRSIRREMASC